MCLLIYKPADVGADVSDWWLEDFHDYNEDGFGFMYAEDNIIHVRRSLGGVNRFKEMWRELQGKECVVHLRMRTHGSISLDNVHPYCVVEDGDGRVPLYMAHNGILRTGNEWDKEKSDTAHFIERFLRPQLERNTDLAFDPAWCEILGELVGDNRFAFMDAYGRVSIINRDDGVEWKGMWLSNTYAWSASRAFGKPSKFGARYTMHYGTNGMNSRLSIPEERADGGYEYIYRGEDERLAIDYDGLAESGVDLDPVGAGGKAGSYEYTIDEAIDLVEDTLLRMEAYDVYETVSSSHLEEFAVYWTADDLLEMATMLENEELNAQEFINYMYRPNTAGFVLGYGKDGRPAKANGEDTLTVDQLFNGSADDAYLETLADELDAQAVAHMGSINENVH